MAKKKNKTLFYLSVAAIAFAAISLIALFLPTIVWKDSDKSYTGLQIAFGYKTKVLGSEIGVFKFSIMNVLTYVLAIGGIVLTLMNAKGKSKLFSLLATACFVVSAVFFFSAIGFTVPASDYVTNETLKKTFELGAGAIVGGICMILAAVCSVGKLLK